MSFPNVYAHRKVADTAKRGCDVCFRPTSSVLLSGSGDAKDFFFVCPAHITDRKFCTPIVDENAAEARKKKAMEDEMEKVKKEYEEKKQKRDAEKEKKDEKSDEKKDDEDDKSKSKEEKGKDVDKPKEDQDPKKSDSSPATPEEEHRFFALQRVFFTQRVQKKREAEMAKRNRERLQQPNLFPSVPKNLPGT